MIRVASTVFILLALFFTEVLAQPVRVQDVCWGESESVCTRINPKPGSPFRFFACWSGGASGFSKQVACGAVCGSAEPCRVTPGRGMSGGECGYRWATLFCGLSK